MDDWRPFMSSTSTVLLLICRERASYYQRRTVGGGAVVGGENAITGFQRCVSQSSLVLLTNYDANLRIQYIYDFVGPPSPAKLT